VRHLHCAGGTVVECRLPTCHRQMVAYIAGSYVGVYTMAVCDKGHYSTTDADIIPRILVLITSCFSLFKNCVYENDLLSDKLSHELRHWVCEMLVRV
jgi:hypothetical protein